MPTLLAASNPADRYGYNGADAMGNNVYYADDAESILYTVASVAALQCRTTRRQTIFQGHTDEVSWYVGGAAPRTGNDPDLPSQPGCLS